MVNFKSLLKEVKGFVFDMDGVLTDGTMLLMPDGEMVRRMNFKDGYALQLAAKKGFQIAIISGGKSSVVTERFNRLGIQHVYLGASDKMEKFEEFKLLTGLKDHEILYMGDDIPDYQVMEQVGVPTCPNDAAEEIKKIAKYISDRKGGEACVRDVVEQTMKMQGLWLDGGAFSW